MGPCMFKKNPRLFVCREVGRSHCQNHHFAKLQNIESIFSLLFNICNRPLSGSTGPVLRGIYKDHQQVSEI